MRFIKEINKFFKNFKMKEIKKKFILKNRIKNVERIK